MDKRIEQEADRCWKEIFPLGWSDTTRLTLSYEEHKAFAQHYYNLALEDVKKEVIKHLEALHKIEHLSAFEAEKAWNRGHEQAFRDILDFIDDK